MNNDRMIEFRLATGRDGLSGEICLMRVSQMMCLFPEHKQIRTIENGWTVMVYSEDWAKVEKAFRGAFLGNRVFAVESPIK